MGEAVLPIDPTRSILGNLLRVVVVLSWQHDDQLKSGLPSVPTLTIGYLLRVESRMHA
jgi:hypothetical protein